MSIQMNMAQLPEHVLVIDKTNHQAARIVLLHPSMILEFRSAMVSYTPKREGERLVIVPSIYSSIDTITIMAG